MIKTIFVISLLILSSLIYLHFVIVPLPTGLTISILDKYKESTIFSCVRKRDKQIDSYICTVSEK